MTNAEIAENVSPIAATWIARATASGLRAAAHLNVAGLLVAALVFFRTPVLAGVEPLSMVSSAAPLLIAAMQLYLMVRIEIDRQLFHALAGECSDNDLGAIDDAFGIILRNKPKHADRTLTERAHATFRFVRLAGALTAAQLLTAALCLISR